MTRATLAYEETPLSAAALKQYRGSVLLYCNGKRHEIAAADAQMTLLEWLRSEGYTGTKLGCGEGGCGACTVVLSSRGDGSEVRHSAVNACLMPVCAADWCMVTTVEGIGSSRRGEVHPIQERLAALHGSQCGFCTPGIVMALYAALRTSPDMRAEELTEKLDGNLCRCTGYRPILDAAASLCIRDDGGSGCCGGGGGENGGGGNGCGSGNKGCGGGGGAGGCAASLPSDCKLLPDGDVVSSTASKLAKHTTPYAVPLPLARAAAGGCEGEAARACATMLRWFASTQIRNVASLGGNIATASPISDMIPTLLACGASLTAASEARGERTVPLAGFVTGYRRVALEPDEVIVSFFVPHCAPLEFVRPYKQARRREDDISIVSCALRVRLEPAQREGRGVWVVSDAALAYGGLAPTAVLAAKTADKLRGCTWDAAAVDALLPAVMSELAVPHDAPGGQPEYRTALAGSFLFKFFEPKPASGGEQRFPHASYPGLESQSPGGKTAWGIEGPRAIEPPTASEKEARRGGDGGADSDRVRVVGESHPHAAGRLHTTGEAEYTDDVRPPAGMLHAWLVRATVAPASILRIDAAAARAMPGVADVIFASDLPPGGQNALGPVAKDEECFADGHASHVGQVIGVAVADSIEAARAAAEAVAVEYGDPWEPPIYTIDAAVAAGSFFDGTRGDERTSWSRTGAALGITTAHDLEAGRDIDEAFAEEGLTVVSGEFRVGGQEHFYLEPMTCLAEPTDDGGISVLSSTQGVDKTHKTVARLLNLPAAKETRTAFLGAVCAAAAYKVNAPVRLALRRDVDMGTTGGRHPFVVKYTAAARRDGEGVPKLAALKAQLYSNGGAFLDLSGPVMDRALLHLDNCYRWPAFSARGVVCRTHTPPNTAFRGFGGPQGLIACEHILEHLATELRVPPDALREANMYAEGDALPFGQVLCAGEWRVPRAWRELREGAEVEARREAAAAFNAAHRWRKRGVAMLPTKFGINFTAKFMNQGGALVHVYTDGTVLITHGGTEMGQGLHTKVCQVAAKAFGVPLSACHVAESASDKVANSIPTAASASTDLYGMATLDACRKILKRLEPVRNKLGPGASLAELALTAWLDRIDLSAHGFFSISDERCGFDWAIQPGKHADGTPDQTTRGHPFNYFTQGCAVAEVEVDVLTGDHAVLRADVLLDLGSSINPALDVGQIEGAFVQGAGWTTTEELIWGDEQHPWVRPQGKLLNSGPGGYKLPAFNDAPRTFNVRLLSGADNPVAVRNAVRAARASHFPDAADAHLEMYSPATSERIRLACADKIAAAAIGGEAGPAGFQPKGSF
ncbi:hypothetical protein EMIHUDRAFT_469173 [Emiliania huxleyi CCMP1516]|uniref:Xanthine dehydrogenase n=2 Tax=Emiliania huxleyi TaxID=2903 RepID=A0A0D3JPI5_EMIH1|nr:hypothetical protein EMIHUDRAFT_469173 [Emiliania huxleyi CCMP1516]EOD25420.1 hypothetical protein EMIHUDRAFT_469173 [Emiliania huxleyi CCMP1516]|eukprot:XP_005777849.1 hypothetical protein EMIHUDRAFT_469173 [Emiliania huxleyi CCMP1516]